MLTKYKLINLEYLDLMADGDDEMKKMMLMMLLDEIPVEIKKMKELIELEDLTQLKEVSHKMKSTLSFVGNQTAIDANKKIEQIAKNNGETEELPILINTLISTYPSILDELQLEYDSI